MSEADLPALLYMDPAAASEQREMLKFAQVQAYCFMSQMRLDEAVVHGVNGKPDSVRVNAATTQLELAREIDAQEGMIDIMSGQVKLLQENFQAAKMTFTRAKGMRINQRKSSVTPHLALAQVGSHANICANFHEGYAFRLPCAPLTS
jgi:aldehyde:ferredoxin oxidoreductase